MLKELPIEKAKKLEASVWAAMQRWVDKGGTLKDKTWGVKWSEAQQKWIQTKKNCGVCAFGSVFVCPPRKNSELLNDFDSHCGDPEYAVADLFGVDLDEEIMAVISGFDNDGEALEQDRIYGWNGYENYKSYFQVGQNLRHRAQKLKAWRGTKG